MTTPCIIAIERDDLPGLRGIEVVTGIKCELDGYLRGGVGEYLPVHFPDPLHVKALIRGGDIRSISDSQHCPPNPEYLAKEALDPGSRFHDPFICTAKPMGSRKVVEAFMPLYWAENAYLMTAKGEWLACNWLNKDWEPLAKALKEWREW